MGCPQVAQVLWQEASRTLSRQARQAPLPSLQPPDQRHSGGSSSCCHNSISVCVIGLTGMALLIELDSPPVSSGTSQYGSASTGRSVA